MIGQSPSIIEESNTIIPNIQNKINSFLSSNPLSTSSLYNNPPIQNISSNLTAKLTDKLLNKDRTITLGRGLDHNKK